MKLVRVYGVGMSPGGNGFVVLLMDEENRVALPIFVGAFEAQAIAMELEKSRAPRPLTHDLFKSVLTELGYKVSKVYINELKDNTFFARLFIEMNGNEIELDARPSDSIALALKFDAPIFVAPEVLQAAGIEQEEAKSENTRRLDSLNERLNKAIENEEFELAAKLRDQIKELKIRSNVTQNPKSSNENPPN
ncbi:MAG: bifunctional nuclease domain-containing protein [Candidatus Hydrogenedentota bacterium]